MRGERGEKPCFAVQADDNVRKINYDWPYTDKQLINGTNTLTISCHWFFLYPNENIREPQETNGMKWIAKSLLTHLFLNAPFSIFWKIFEE